MSRIILTKWEGTDEPRHVVGWDRPCSSFFWQEFNQEPKVEQDGEGKWKVTSYAFPEPRIFDNEAEAEQHKWDDWEEMARYAGYIPSELPNMQMFRQSLSDDMQRMVTENVEVLLMAHTEDPDAGHYVVDLTSNVVMATSYKVEVQTHGSDTWASNAVRFATEDEAKEAAQDLSLRWTMLKEWRIAASTDPVNYKWENGGAVSVTAG